MFSFLKEKRSVPGLTGIALRDDGVSVVRVLREPGRSPRVTACEYRSWGNHEGERAKALARVAADFDLKSARCTTALDANEYALLLTEAPDVPADELRAAVRWRIKDLIDFHVDDATLDVFDVTTANATAKSRSMYVVAARNSAIQRRVDQCDSAGINLDIIDIPELAQRNLASILEEDVRGVVMLSFSEQSGLITITRQGELFLSRRIELGLETLKQADDRATYFDQIVLEVQRSLDYFDSHFRQAHIDSLVLVPPADDVPGIIDYLNENLNIKSKVAKLEQVLQFDVDATPVLRGQGLLALGAALRQEEKAL